MKKRGRPQPQWLIELNSGIYCLQELAKKVNRSTRTVKQVAVRRGASVEYRNINGKLLAFIKWEGSKNAG